jgi:hypothetical protein
LESTARHSYETIKRYPNVPSFVLYEQESGAEITDACKSASNKRTRVISLLWRPDGIRPRVKALGVMS